jgi:hypothetical protein
MVSVTNVAFQHRKHSTFENKNINKDVIIYGVSRKLKLEIIMIQLAVSLYVAFS